MKLEDRPIRHRSHLFTVRIWPEELGNDQVEWRGRVQHVTGGKSLFFRDWPALLEFLTAALVQQGSVSEERA